MAVGETAKLIATLELKDKFSPTVNKAVSGLGRLDSRIDKTASKGTQLGQHIGIGIQNGAKIAAIGVGLLATQVALGLNSLVKLEQAQAQTAAVLKSTGQAAGITGEQVTALAEKYESLNAIVGDEVIRSAENLLLTFTNVRKDAFEPALEAILNMNTAMGKGPEGLNTTVLQVGKALNDPIKGLTALRKNGVAFTDAQIKQIKALQKSGDLLGAQKIILGELNKEFGNSFLLQGNTTAAKVAKFGDAIEDLQRTLAAGLLPVVSKVADKLSALFADPKVTRAVEEFGTNLAGLFSDENLATGARVLESLFNTAKEVAPAIASAAKVTGAVVKTAVEMFTSLPKELQTLIIGGLAVNKLTGGIVTNLASGLISSVLKQLVSGVVNVNGAVVNVTGVPGGGGLPGAAAGAGIGVKALAVGGAAAGVIVLLQEASKEAAKAFNTEFAKVGAKTQFQGAQFGPQGIIPAIQNLLQIPGAIDQLLHPGLDAVENAVFVQSQKNTTEAEKTRASFVTEMTGFKSAFHDSATKQTNAIERNRAGISAAINGVKTATKDSATKQSSAVERNRVGISSAINGASTKTTAQQRASASVVSAAARHAGTEAAGASRSAGQAAKSGGLAAARAIDRKKMSFSTSVRVTTTVSVRDNIAATNTVSKYGHKVL